MENQINKEIGNIVSELEKNNNSLFKRTSQWKQSWNKIHKELQKDQFEAPVLKEQFHALKDWPTFFPEQRDMFVSLKDMIDRKYFEYISQYTAPLQKWCLSMNYSLEGDFPRYTIDAYIEVFIEKEKNQAKINNKKVKNIGLTTIIPIIKKEYDRIWDQPLDHTNFINQIKVFYRNICEREHINNDYIPINFLYKEYKNHDKNCTVEVFSAHFSRLIENNITIFDLAPIRDSSSAITIYNRKTHEKFNRGLIKF